MLSSSIRIIIISLAIFAISCANEAANSEPETKVAPVKQQPAEKTEAEVPPGKPKNKVATFAVPEMDEARIGGLISALANDKGVLEAKPDKPNSTLSVTFVPGDTNPKKIQAALEKVVPGVTLSKLETTIPGEAPAHDCGGCPMRNSCEGDR